MLDFERLRKEAFVFSAQDSGFDSAGDSAGPAGLLRATAREDGHAV